MTSPTAWLRRQAQRLAASTTAASVLLVGMPLALDYVVRPGDTLSEIAQRHSVSVQRLVRLNDLHPSGQRVYAGQRLTITRDGAAQRRSGGAAKKPRRYGPDARRMVRYTVRPGDTATGLAVRFHAWTAELISVNNLGPSASLRVGQTITIPVVLAAVEAERRAKPPPAQQSPAAKKPAKKPAAKKQAKPATRPKARKRLTDPSRAEVRRIITRTAHRYGVDPALALAISWQEAGWRQYHVSSAHAIGAMQVLPSTGRWISQIVGRPLGLRGARDNIEAGVAFLDWLLANAESRRQAIGGYYQGLASVQSRGFYSDTERYVANVLALRKAFRAGRYPA